MCELQRVSEQVSFMKEDMQETVKHIGPDNAERCFALLTSQYEVIQGLYKIEKLKAGLGVGQSSQTDSPPESEGEQEFPEQDEPIVDSEDVTMTEVTTSESERRMYRVERKLKGAFVVDIEGYIPESILRQMDIEHGDYVYAEPVPAVKFGQNRFRYELAKKSDGELVAGRIEYKGCPIIRDGQLLVVKQSSETGKSIKLNDSPYSVVINDRDIMQFGLTEGDIVDVAFYESNPTSAAVIWKHEVFDEPIEIKQKQKKSAYRKDTEDDDCPDIEPVFAGQTICLIGDKPNESAYKRLIEERGGKHLHVEPKWNVRRIQTHVKNSDVVVGMYDASGHTGLEKAKEYCKRYGKPFRMISGTGKSKAIQTAVELLAETS